MAQINRLVVSRGPALITFAGAKFFSKEDMVVDFSKSVKALPSSAYGDLDSVIEGSENTLKFTPVGEFEHLAVLFPYGATLPGTSIFGNADAPLLVQPLDTTQKQITFHAAGISKMPDLTFAATETLFGEVEFSFVGKNNTPTDDPNYYFTEANNALTGASPYDPDALIVQSYRLRWLSGGTFTLTFGADTTGALDWDSTDAEVDAAFNAIASVVSAGGATVTGNVDDGWLVTFDSNGDRGAITGTFTGNPAGTAVKAVVVQEGTAGLPEIVRLTLSPWHNFNSREGVKVTLAASIEPDTADAIGVYDKIFRGLTVSASLIPQGVSQADLLAAAAVQGPASVRGRKLSAGGANLDIIGEGVFFRLNAANITKSGLIFGAANQRLGAVEFAAARSVGAGGTINPLFVIGTEEPA